MVAVFTICAGITSGRMSLEGEIEIALYFILLAVFLDAGDGKLARYLDAAGPVWRRAGYLGEFFSTSELYRAYYCTIRCTSGRPSQVSDGWRFLFSWSVVPYGLPAFNLSSKSEPGDQSSEDVFVGVPAPALACLALMPVFMHL